MKRTYRQIDGKLVEVTRGQSRSFPSILPDIEPYQSMITGEMITSRSRHRQHLRDHGCVEVGNDVRIKPENKPNPVDISRRELIRAQFNELDHKRFKQVVKKSVQQARGY